MQTLVIPKGGQCLSDEYVNAHTKLKWRCAKGHEWDATPDRIRQGSWCPDCRTRKVYTIEDMNRIARERGGECLSSEYISLNKKLQWRCEKGHQWMAVAGSVVRGSWCRICQYESRNKQRRRWTIEDMHDIAHSRGGECLSNKYLNTSTPLKWRCDKGHEWESRPYSIINGSWCHECKGMKKGTIEEMMEIARAKGGTCLSTKYINANTPLRWRCSEGHEWMAAPHSVKRGSWCNVCLRRTMGKEQRFSVNDMTKVAQERGGSFLSSTYQGTEVKHKWRCKDGHEWKATPRDVIQDHWCPICSSGMHERICREVFERIFSQSFPKSRPKWLINPSTGRLLELDGYCEGLSLAFEYHGQQHYDKDRTFFHKQRSFDETVTLDVLKRNLCEENNVTLIEVPFSVEPVDMPQFIIRACRVEGISTPQVDLDLFSIDKYDLKTPFQIDEYRRIAEERGGECLSDVYVTNRTPLRWRCSKGHEWQAKPHDIKGGTWCPTCAGNKLKTLDDAKKLAAKKNGYCLSNEFVNTKSKLRWRCEHGHEWVATYSDILQRRWCPTCGLKSRVEKRKLSIDDLRKMAQDRGGELLSTKYVNTKTRMKWRCKEGHIWEVAAGGIRSGNWCPQCAINRRSSARRHTINEMKSLAKNQGGECLSTEYVNNRTPLKWRCAKGHEWKTPAGNILAGTWCPICANWKRVESRTKKRTKR